MEGLADASEAVLDWIHRSLPTKIKTIYFFTDNTGSIQRIFKGTPGKAQACSIRFRKAALEILDTFPDSSITIEWTPGHHGIDGNEEADSLAKDGSFSLPPNPEWHSISFIGAGNTKLLREDWIQRWASARRHPGSDFSLADRFAPQHKPTARFMELTRVAFTRIIQARTGHAHIGAYYRNFVPTEDSECPCGQYVQTRHHILSNCPMYDEYRHLLGETDEDRSTAALVGTSAGINRLSEFLMESSAFTKALDP
jgi:hypothetical protein